MVQLAMNNEMMLALIEEGDKAFQDGLCMEECCYEPKTSSWEYWVQGWQEAYDADAPARESEAKDKVLDNPQHESRT
jgi:ribosome modulation factor